MPTIDEVKTAVTGSKRRQFILQSAANSTVAGGAVEINFDGEYIYAVRGTMNGAKPTLHIQREGTSGFTTLTASEITVDGGSAIVQLTKGDDVYSQTTVVGGSTSYDAVLNPTTI